MWAEFGTGRLSQTTERKSRGVARRGRIALPWLALPAALLILAGAGCDDADHAWRLPAEGVRFAAGEVSVALPSGHPLHWLELRDGTGALLLSEPLPPGAPYRVRFAYPWGPAERLRLRGVAAWGTVPALAVTAPARPAAPVTAVLQLPAGVALPAGTAALQLPPGAAGTLVLALRAHADGPFDLTAEVTLPPFLELQPAPAAGPGAASLAASPEVTSTIRRRVVLALRNETARVALPFRVRRGAAGQQGPLAWRLEGLPGQPLAGTVRLAVPPTDALRAGLTVAESAFPADAAGRVLRQQPRERITLPATWATSWLGWLGVAPAPDPYRPWGFTRLAVHNALPGDAVVVARTRILAESSRAAEGFGDPLLAPGRRETVSMRRIPAGGTAVIAEPVHVDVRAVAPGRYRRCTELLPWGMEGTGTTRCVSLRVARSPLAGWAVVWGGTLLALGLLMAGMLTMHRWARAFPLRDLVLIALLAGMAFLVVSVPGLVVRTGAALLLGPFSFLVEGLVFKFLLFLLLGCLFALVRRPGVFFLFYGLWMAAQAVLSGHYSPVVVLFAGATIAFIEGGLWLSGLTRAGRRARRPWLAGALWVGLAEGASVFWSLQLIKLLFRVYLADWFVALQAGSEGLYAGLGLAVGLRLGMRLAAARRPALAGRMEARPPRPLPAGEPVPLTQPPSMPSREPGVPLLAVEGLGFAYPGAAAPVLRDVNLRVEAGQVVLLAGRSGAGKTTLLRLLQGLLPWPEGARLRLAGQDAETFSPRGWAAACGLLFQEPALQVVRPTVRGEVAFGIEVAHGVENGSGAVEGALRLFGLVGLAARGTATLSGGELQRTALAGLHAVGPRVLLLDEPLAHLDAQGRALLVEQVAGLAAAGCAVLVAEHRPEALLPIAQRVVWLERGRPPWQGTPRAYAARGHGAAFLRTRSPAVARRSLPRTDSPPLREGDASPLARFEGVGVHFPGAPPLLAGVDATLGPGRAIALTGANGTGKSTLLALLLGLRRPDAGRVRVAGRAAHRLSWRERARRFGYVPQQAELVLQAPTAIEELAASLRWRGRGAEAARAEAADWLARLGLAGLGGRPPHLLSRGERQRLALGAAMIAAPPLLVLDEPFAGQDPEHLAVLLELLQGYLAEDPARGLLVATHDYGAAAGAFDLRWHLAGGGLEVSGTVPAPHRRPVQRAAAGGGA